MITKSANVSCPDGHSISSVDYTLDGDTARAILEAQKAFKTSSLIEYIKIKGDKVWGSVIQYDSTIDDPERKVIQPKAFGEWSGDVVYIEISRAGSTHLISYNDWLPEETLSFEIE